MVWRSMSGVYEYLMHSDTGSLFSRKLNQAVRLKRMEHAFESLASEVHTTKAFASEVRTSTVLICQLCSAYRLLHNATLSHGRQPLPVRPKRNLILSSPRD